MTTCVACTKEIRRTKAEKRAQGVLEGQPDKRGRVLSDDERERRSSDLKRRHASGELDAVANGRKGGASNYRTRIVDHLLNRNREPDRLDLIDRAYERGLRSRNQGARQKAADALVAMEMAANKNAREDRGAGKSPDEMTPEELKEVVRQGIEGMLRRGEINLSDLGSVISLSDADVVEVDR